MTAQSEINLKKQRQRNIESVVFPEDIGDFYLSIDFYDYRVAIGDNKSPVSSDSNLDSVRRFFNANKESVNNQIFRPSSFARIKLPLPTNLVDHFRSNYENTALGTAIGSMSAIGEGIGAAGSLGQNLINGEDFDESLNRIGELVGAGGIAAGMGIANYLSAQNVLFGSNIGGLFDLAFGTVVNPNLAVLFRGPNLKTHNFQWHMTPRSKQEAHNIEKIRAIIKRAMHPTQINRETSVILRYPSECLVQFVGIRKDRQLFFPMRPTVVTDFSINHAPNGMISLFQDEYETALDFSLSLQETSYYTRDSFDNQGEYGSDGFKTEDLTEGVNAFGVNVRESE